MTTANPGARRRAGWLATLVVAAIYGGLALGGGFANAAMGLHSDESTYYLMGHSLAADGDLEYRRADIERGYREFPSGPGGLFLKRGTDVTGFGVIMRPPFVEFPGTTDPDTGRLFYGKSFAYPLFAAPFVKVFGTEGFLVFNALLLCAAFLAAYLFVSARSGIVVGLVVSSAFVFATVVPVYFVWIQPELFNFALGLVAYVLWLYKVVALEPTGRGSAWLRAPWTDWAAGAIIGLATFSKVTNVLLLVPLVAWLAWRRQWRQAVMTAAACALVGAAFFGANVAVTGEWSYQGSRVAGDRRTCYGPFPFQQETIGLEVCEERGRDEALGDIIFDGQVFWSNLRHNAVYYFVGRSSGLVAYFFPAVFGMIALLLSPRAREPWHWFVFAGILLQILVFIITLPYSWFGGGGSVGNRYFMGVYGTCLFLIPALRSWRMASLLWIVGGLFMAKLVLNPFHTSFRPGEHVKAGPLRLLPIELTNVNDIPINTDTSRVRIWYGETETNPGFQVYYLDDNSYLREAAEPVPPSRFPVTSFWTRGESRAEIIVKVPGESVRGLPVRRLQLTLTAGPVPTDVVVRVGWRTVRASLAPGATQDVSIDLGSGVLYNSERKGLLPVTSWVVSIASSAGFSPRLFDPASNDVRFLGVRVRPLLTP